jgi:hypothetical protein
MDNVILVFANLDDIATKEEVEKFYQDEYSNSEENTISFEEYIKKEKTIETETIAEQPDNLE